jgi:hypothetical protein
MPLIRYFFLLVVMCVSLSATSSAHGHETVPENWCVDSKTTPTIVSKFKWDMNQLISAIHRCGIVDSHRTDRWSSAYIAAHFYCETQSPQNSLAVPFIIGPESYNDKRHHEMYRLEDGLEGSCAVCVPQSD